MVDIDEQFLHDNIKYQAGFDFARVAELVDALDLGSSGVTRGGSSPPSRTSN